MSKRATAVLLAGGSGTRMGTRENKIFLPLAGRAVLLHSLESVAAHPRVKQIVLVTRPADEAYLQELLQGFPPGKPYQIVHGGGTRQQSVANALAVVQTPHVLIHDAARPFITAQQITNCLQMLKTHHGATSACPVQKAVYRRNNQNLNRLTGTLYAAQTPQGFRTKTLKKCHAKRRDMVSATDDSSLLEQAGYSVAIATGDPQNIKITTPLDLVLAEQLVR